MQRPHALICTLGLLAVFIAPASAAQSAPDPLAAPGEMQPAAPSPFVAPDKVEPDYAYAGANGTRVEIYTSAGDNDEAQDWSPINEYAYLVGSVPKYKQIYSTVYNALQDGDKAVRTVDPLVPTNDQWSVEKSVPSRTTYAPTQAFLNVLNAYSTAAERKQYVHVLGNKTSIDDSVAAGSGLASLLKEATDYKDCRSGEGACLTTRPSGENYMHAKYAAFQQAKDSTGTLRNNVIWITSSNLNGASGGKKSNVSIAIYNDALAYNGLVKLWNYEAAEDKAGFFGDPISDGIDTSNGKIKLYASPRTASSDLSTVDYESDLLKDSANAVLATQGKAPKTDCRVYAVHSLYSRGEITNGLSNLKTEGCDVKVVLGLNAISDVASYYFESSAKLRELIDSVEFANVHDKTLSVSYKTGGTPVGTTFGGSANFNGTSLQYDELAFRADDVDFTKVVQRHSERIFRLARGVDDATPVTSVAITPSTNVQIAQGGSLKLKATVAPDNASVKTVTWSTGNSGVATVDANGVVTGVNPGVTTIRALSVSAAKTHEITVQVVGPGGTTTSPDTTPDKTLQVSTPPELTMQAYQGYQQPTKAVVTWSQGEVPLSGDVMLQYYAAGAWKNYKTIKVVNGRGVGSYVFAGSHTWRADASSLTTPNAVRTSAANTPRGISPVAVRTKASSSTLRLYGPDLIVSTTEVPYIISWNNPYAGRSGINNNVRLQYLSGSTWVTAQTFTVPDGVYNFEVSWPATNTRKWRLASGLTSQPKGVAPKYSGAITVNTLK